MNAFDMKINAFDFIATLGFYNPAILPKCDVCFYPFLDCEADFYIRYEVGTEEGVVALLLCEFAGDSTNKAITNFVKSLDYGYLSAETNISEEELKELKKRVQSSKNPLLLIGEDIMLHSRKQNMLNILSALLEISGMDIMLLRGFVPPIYTLESIQDLPENNGCVIYANKGDSPQNTLKISKEFARAWRLTNGENISFDIDKKAVNATCKIDENFSGIIGILQSNLQNVGYPFKHIAIKRH